MKDPTPGDICRHYKGGLYIIMAIAIHSEDRIELVVYRSLSNETVWARPKEMFCENIIVQSRIIERFEKVK